ncbi:transcriptional regulator [Streptomyces sviceus ATCC 29083]|uniref:Transcriptional regulator n=1 Tax=Streptomyces sviceus (strain ATCC 29083 / DSM 924 / JCM 4929 / NBRC 13980 / NCIMB 11184 / NRRL 5439 / UC 5370) TaxID=463191 RepID=D6XC01_STRX2|nr:transcriptional regulator [Streptomyces sviceus ATCC 29083]
METLTFDSDDLDRTEEFLSRAYAKMRIGNGTPDSSRARIHRSAIDSVSVDELALDFDMSYAVTPLGRICLCVVHEGTIEDHVYQGVSDSFGPGDVVSFAPPELSYAGRVHAARYNITMLDPDLLTQVAATADTRRPEPVRLTGHRPLSPAAGDRLRTTIRYMQDHVLADAAVADQPLVASTAAQHLAATVLATFPQHRVHRPHRSRPPGRPPRRPAPRPRPHRRPRRPAPHRRPDRGGGPHQRPRAPVRLPPSPGQHPARVPAPGPPVPRPRRAGGRRPRGRQHGHRHRRPLGLLPPGPLRHPVPARLRPLTAPYSARRLTSALRLVTKRPPGPAFL